MDFIIVIGIGAILVATGIITPAPKDDEVAQTNEVKTEEVTTPPTEIKPEPEPEPEPEPTPEPEPAPEPELAPEPEPAKEPEPTEEINQNQVKEEEAKPEEPEIEPSEDDTELEEEGTGWLNILLYILGAIAVIAAGVYFFMRRDPEPKTAADLGRQESSQQSDPEPTPTTEPEQPIQEETPTQTTEEDPQPENNDQSSNNDDENNNR